MPTFRFGQPMVGNVYSFRQPYGRNATTRNRTTASCNLPATPTIPGQSGGTGGSSRLGGYDISRFNPAYDRLEEGSVIEDWIPRDIVGLNKLFRIIYTRDSICGPAVDIMSNLPWSSFDLHGIDDKKLLEFYEDAAQLFGDKAQEMPAITIEYMVLGRFCASLIYDEAKGFWTDFVPHDSDFLTITPIPVRNFDPKIDMVLSPGVRQFVNSLDYRDVTALGKLPESLINAMRRGAPIPLDPLNTLYLRRKSSPTDFVGTSSLTRIVPYWAVEKALMNAMVTAARRRAGNILHITAGVDERWEPSPEEMEDIAGLFIQADEDPVGAVVATRTGVDASEIRSGGDIWKWSDEWQWLSEAKMRGMGISEALLSGDACVTADTLVTTDRGLLRIGDICRKSDGEWQNIDLTVASRYGPARAAKWLYNGIKPTLTVTSEWGHELTCTYNHPFLVLDHDFQLVWKRSDELELGNHLCIPTAPLTRSEPLPLNLPDSLSPRPDLLKPIRRPEVMTPALAQLLGLIVSEGTVSISGSYVSFSNSDRRQLDKYKMLMVETFSLTCTEDECAGSEHTKKTCRSLLVCSRQLVDWLQYLGLYCGKRKNGKTPSYHKIVPWSVLQADANSQLAYVAGFLDGDGSVTKNNRIVLSSVSEKMIAQLQVMLGAHGIIAPRIRDGIAHRLTLGNRESVALWDKIRRYAVKTFDVRPLKDRQHFGFPSGRIHRLLRERRAHRQLPHFMNDNHQVVALQQPITLRGKKLLYDRHDNGGYDSLLEGLRQFAPEVHDRVARLMALKYKFVRVVSIEQAGERDVFDLSMQQGSEPAFVANSLMIHNTYSNMEQARSTFTEQILALRQYLTNQVYYRRFKTLARAHGFRKKKKAELDHRIRIKREGHEDESPEIRTDDLSLKNLSQEEAFDIPEEDLIVPTIQWHKSLLPEGDRDYLDILTSLKEEGVPIPLKVWAARGGYDLTEALDMLDEDVKLRERIEKWKKQTGGGGDDEGGMFGETEADSSPLWDPADRFMQLKKPEAKRCLQQLVNTVYQPGKHQVLADTRFVTRTCSEILHGTRKVELMHYVLMRLGVCRGLPVSAETGQAILDYLAAKPNLSTRRRMQELNAAARLLNQQVDESDPVVDKCLAGVLEQAATGGLELEKPALRVAR
jgi:hypothetical protein